MIQHSPVAVRGLARDSEMLSLLPVNTKDCGRLRDLYVCEERVISTILDGGECSRRERRRGR